MSKQALIDNMADEAGISKAQAGQALDAFVDFIKESLARGDSVSLVGFGTFERRERSARTGRNPQTGEELRIPASRVPAFKAGKALKDAVK